MKFSAMRGLLLDRAARMSIRRGTKPETDYVDPLFLRRPILALKLASFPPRY